MRSHHVPEETREWFWHCILLCGTAMDWADIRSPFSHSTEVVGDESFLIIPSINMPSYLLLVMLLDPRLDGTPRRVCLSGFPNRLGGCARERRAQRRPRCKGRLYAW